MTTSITSLPSASVPLTGTERVPMDQTIGSAVSASALVVGTGYRIESLGTTNWTACGLPAGVTAAVGLTFVATAAGTGTGTAIEAQTVEATAAAIAALAPATNLAYDQATRLLSSSTGTDVTLPLATDALDGLQSAAQRALVQALITAGVTAAGSTVTIPHIHGDLAGALYIHVKNTSAGTLAKGSPVYPTGTVGDTTTLEVAGADSSNANLLPAVGLLADALAPNASGHAVIAGELTGLNTAAYAIGDALYVASGGGLTATRPTTGTIQQVAIVGRVNSGTGSVTVTISTELSPNWDVAYSQRLRWDGGATGLNAATGRASLELAAVATTGAYSDLSGRPTLGTAAAANTGTAAGNVVILDGSARLPAVDGSQLTGLPSAFNPASPGAIGGTTPAAGTFTALVATTRLGIPSGAPASPAARDLYVVGDTVRYRDSTGAERLLPNGADNLALGAADNAIVRSDGTTGTTVQGSDVIIDDYTAATLGNIHISARNAVFSCTATAADDFILAAGHTFANGDQVQFSALTGGTGLSTATRYFVRDAEDGRFKVASATGSAAVDITADATAGTVNLMISIGLAPTLGGVFYLGQRPDGTAVGGATRGPFSIDLQTNRTLSGQVASGFSSAILGGSGNTATGNTSVVLGGSGNTASGTRSCAGGFQAVASRINTFAWSGGGFSAAGDCQMLFAVMRNRTTNATPTEVFLEGTATRLTVPSGRILAGVIDCIGTRSDGLSVARFRRLFAIKNVSGTTSLVGSVQTVNTDYEDNASTDIAIDADDTSDALRIRVTGIAGETWRWMVRVDWSEIAWGT